MEIGTDISSGDAFPHFEAISDNIGIAIDAMLCHLPMVRHVALRRLCTGASVAQRLRGDGRDPRQAPGRQVHPAPGSAVPPRHTQVGHCYRQRRMPKAVRLELRRDDVAGHAGCGLLGNLERAGGAANPGDHAVGFQQRMGRSRTPAPWPTLLLLSVDDDTAREFEASARLPAHGSGALVWPEVRHIGLPVADHTGSGTIDQRVDAAVTRDIRRSLQVGSTVAPASPAGQPIEDRT